MRFAIGVLVLALLGAPAPAAAACTGEEISKMIGAGFSKEEIKKYCPTDGGSPSRPGTPRETRPGQAHFSTTCQYTQGPKTGRVQYFEPTTPGLRPALVGQPCTDGMGSWGTAVPDRR